MAPRAIRQGFCGVRFNPYLWPEGGPGMKDETGLALYRRAGELGMPVGVMCFKGLCLHLDEIKALLESSPETKVRRTLAPAMRFGRAPRVVAHVASRAVQRMIRDRVSLTVVFLIEGAQASV